jgi:predicted Zn finger-like uncharacterized protein
MIVDCPACSSRFRLNKAKFSGQKVSLKCVQCQKLFQVDVPSEETTPQTGIHVLIAHSDPSLCTMLSEIVSKSDIGFVTCHDGESALRMMAECPPHVAIVDVALPGLYAFEVVEKVRALPGLSEVKIILLSSVYNKMAYKRSPASLYGADAYIEKHHVPGDLVLTINALLTGSHQKLKNEPWLSDEVRDMASTHNQEETTESLAFADEMNSKIQQAEEKETSASTSKESNEKAHRLARNIVADIALYNQKKVDSGIVAGTFFDLLADEIAEGRRLFNDRFTPESLNGVDVLQSEFESFLKNRRAEIS